MIAKQQNTYEEHQDPYNSSLFCERIVAPFVLARYRLQHSPAQEENRGPQSTEVRSLQELDDPAVSTNSTETTLSKPSVQSLNSLTPKNQTNVESIIESVRKRLNMKDEAKKQMRLTVTFRKPSETSLSSPKYGATTQPYARQSKALTEMVKFPQKKIVVKLSRASVPSASSQRKLKPHIRANSLPTCALMKLEGVTDSKDSVAPSSGQKSSQKQFLIKTVRFSLTKDEPANDVSP